MPATIFSMECRVPAIASLWAPLECPPGVNPAGVLLDCGEKMLEVGVVEALDAPNAAAIAAA